MSFGTLTGLDTRGSTASALAVGDETWAEGDILYAHPTVAGKLTNVRPKHDLAVAFITVRHASTGQIAVRIVPGNFHLEWLHDVDIDGTPADNELLAYDSSSGTWINQTPSEAGVAATAGATFTGTVVMSNVGVDINDTDSRVGRIIGSGNIMYIQGGADSADTAARVIIGRLASSGNISQLDLRADTTNILGKVEVAQKQNALVVSAYNSATADPDKFANNSRVIMTAAATGSSDPTTRPDGTALQAGDVWIDW
jgi:hypothetical protein